MRAPVIALIATACGACTGGSVDGLRWGTCGQAPPADALQAQPAAAFLDSVGVKTSFDARDTPYGDLTTSLARLRELGVRHVRQDALAAERDERNVAAFRELGRRGVRTTLQLNTGSDPAALARALGPALEAVQVPTPLDGGSGRPPVTDTTTNTMAVRASLAALAPADRPLLVGALLANQIGAQQIGSLAAFVDAGAAWYPRPPVGDAFDSRLAQARQWYGDKPLWVTAGQYYPLATGTSEASVSAAVQARGVLRSFLGLFAAGATRTYYAGLYDGFSDARDALIGNDGVARPSYAALAALAAVLEDAETPVTPARVPVHVATTADGGATDVRRLLLQRSDGTFVLLLWLDVAMIEAETERQATISFAAPVDAVTIVRLHDRGEPTVALGAQGVVETTVSDHPSALTFRLACP